MGRQGRIDEVTWEADGWPAINGGRGPSRTVTLPAGGAPRVSPGPVEDDFTGAVLDPRWQWPVGSAGPAGGRAGARGWLRLAVGTSAATVAAARPTIAGSYVATTVVDPGSITAGAQAGLAAFGNRDNLLAVTVEGAAPGADGRTAGDALSATVWQAQKGQRTILAVRRVERRELLHLRLVATDRTRFQFAVSADGRTWDTLSADAQGGFLPPWDPQRPGGAARSRPAGRVGEVRRLQARRRATVRPFSPAQDRNGTARFSAPDESAVVALASIRGVDIAPCCVRLASALRLTGGSRRSSVSSLRTLPCAPFRRSLRARSLQPPPAHVGASLPGGDST